MKPADSCFGCEKDDVEPEGAGPQTVLQGRMDRALTHRVWGTLIFLGTMGLMFQAIYTCARPLMDGVDGVFAGLRVWTGAVLPEGALQSLVGDGVIAGVGSVVVFLPQIAILFAFLATLEECGYMARAAFLTDHLLARCGLSGRSFVPLLSSFACAVPGILATRAIEDRRARLTTMLVAPLMSCSARLPVYTLFIAAFIPDRRLLGGVIGLQGLTLLAMYGLGVAVAIPTAWLLKRTLLRGEAVPFTPKLPPCRVPDFRKVGLRICQSCTDFLMGAGTVILAATVVMWALAYFPRPAEVLEAHGARMEEARKTLSGEARAEALRTLETEVSAELMEQSYLGRAGHLLEPAVRPLGWDWRIGVATLASFLRREMMVASLGTLCSLGKEPGNATMKLRIAMRTATGGEGHPAPTAPVALSIMVFFALCTQCVPTLALIGRESGTWRWTAFTLVYTVLLAYGGAIAVYQAATVFGWGG